MGFSTDAIHAGQGKDPLTGAVTPPIYQTSTFALNELGQRQAFGYTRSNNPTRQALEQNVATLEQGRYACAFSSGMAAIFSALALLKPGSHVIASDPVYGGSYRLFEQIMCDYNIHFTYVDTSALQRVRQAIRPETRMLYVESPTNPLITLTDLRGTTELAREHDLIQVVDNTFMSPYFQRPLTLGVDVVVHSTTKYLNGHCDVIGGIAVTNNETLYQRLKLIQKSVGAVPSPLDAWLVLRGIKTLALRMRQHNQNAQVIARFLADHPKVKAVYYPGLPSHPQYELGKRQMTGFGGMLAFELEGLEAAKRLTEHSKLFYLAVSLGGVESLICHPWSMTHASVPSEVKRQSGIREGLIRLSVGVEDVEDLVADLEQALQAV